MIEFASDYPNIKNHQNNFLNKKSEMETLKSKSIPLQKRDVTDNSQISFFHMHSSSTHKYNDNINKTDLTKQNISTNNNNLNSNDYNNLILIQSIDNFFKFLNESKKKIFFAYLKLTDLINFSLEIVEIIKQKNEMYYDESKNIIIELELAKKSEHYLKNCFIFFLQNNLKEYSEVIPISKFEEVILDLNEISKNLNDKSAPDLVEKSNKISTLIKIKVEKIIIEKDEEIRNLNQRILFFLKETQTFKKIINTAKTQNINLLKNSFLNLIDNKDNEIKRLDDIINNLKQNNKKDLFERCDKSFTESRINMGEYKEDIDKSQLNNNISINLSVDISKENNPWVKYIF